MVIETYNSKIRRRKTNPSSQIQKNVRVVKKSKSGPGSALKETKLESGPIDMHRVREEREHESVIETIGRNLDETAALVNGGLSFFGAVGREFVEVIRSTHSGS